MVLILPRLTIYGSPHSTFQVEGDGILESGNTQIPLVAIRMEAGLRCRGHLGETESLGSDLAVWWVQSIPGATESEPGNTALHAEDMGALELVVLEPCRGNVRPRETLHLVDVNRYQGPRC